LGVFIDPAVTVVVNAVTGLGRGLAALSARVEQTFVGLAVTVVVSPVAELLLRPDVFLAGHEPAVVGALTRIRFAGRGIAAAYAQLTLPDLTEFEGDAALDAVLVHQTVTIIVCSIAGFSDGQDAVTIDPLAHDTAREARAACPHVATTRPL